MILQARARATHDTIIKAAVDIFAKVGYGEAGMVDIIAAAGVTKGAFYYHFPTKESVAWAVLREAYGRLHAVIAGTLGDQSSPALENMIRANFVAADLMRTDRLVRVGHELRQALPTGRDVSPPSPATRRAVFVEASERAIAEGDVLDDVDPGELANMIRGMAVGAHVLTGTADATVFTYLAEMWRILVRGIVPAQSVGYYHEFITRMAHHYGLRAG